MDIEEKNCSDGAYFVQRKVLDELSLDEVAQKRTWSTEPTLRERVKESLRCSVPRLKRIALSWVPVLSWLPHYSIRENAVGDLISGCSVGIMHLPQGMAYALLASLGPVFGLYTSLYPVLVYFIFGTSRHISIGTFAVISIMIGTVTERLAPDSKFIANGTNQTGSVDLDARDASRVQIACSLTVLAGIFQILLGVVRFGFVVTYLSEPLVRGYTTGSACHVCVSQLKYLFGVTPARFTGPFSLIYTLVDVCRLLPETKVPELFVSLVALFVLILVKEINACYRQKLPMPIPIEIVVIIAATIITHFCGLTSKYSIDVVGKIPSGLNAPQAPNATFFSDVIGDAFAVAIVSYAINISLGKTFALKHGYKVDSNQELIALGLCNTVGSFFQCYSVTSSLSRSLVQESTGGKTQVAGVISSIIVLITVLQIGSLFSDLPKAVLSTIVFVNLKGMFTQFMDVHILWKTNRVDLLVWLVTFTSTLLLNLDLGLAVSIGFSMLTVIFRTQLPRYSILGHVTGTALYLDTDTYKEAKEIPGIKIFRSSTTIYYANAEMYSEALQEKSGLEIGKLLTAMKKRDAKLKRKQEKEKKEAKMEAKKQRKAVSQMSNGAFSEVNERKVSAGVKGQSQGHVTALSLTEISTHGQSKGQVNRAYQDDTTMSDSDSDMGSHIFDSITQVSKPGGEKKGKACGSSTHSIILDIATTSFVDTVTVKTLKNIFRDFGEIDVDIYLAGCQACVVEQLETAGFFSESIPKSRLFVTIHDAVLHSLKKQTDFVLDVSCSTQM
ncbi:solute carrier family 26 member 6 isoform X2 [Etheostoma spectabile]|uniref:solute carrier family 26 member 6 isoform X2 n=1 Tax=Etheostoma spectabile TaxID=54343 RepID=UPI0013AF3545|nr:solute carrier family 26 member 6-like isoform X2 [Etheostoma spectabile]